MNGQRRRNIAGAAVLVLLVALFAFWLTLPESLIEALGHVQTWADSLGPWGPALFVLLYVLAVVLLVPGSVLALAAGLVYGPWGLPLALVGATTGAALSFLIGRHLAGPQVRLLSRRRPVLRAVESAVRDGGWRFVGLVRLSPLLPFNLLNYFFGVTRIPFQDYLLATFAGIVPGTSVNVFIAAASQAVGPETLHHPLRLALFGVGLIVTVVVCRIILRRVRIALRQAGAATDQD
ncbi:MAG: TVP38/TMEM64 family protein [Noviherbaspirillum sp.]